MNDWKDFFKMSMFSPLKVWKNFMNNWKDFWNDFCSDFYFH